MPDFSRASRLLSSGALRGGASMTASTMLGQVAVLAATPILSRLYDPVAFGVFGVLTSFSLIAATAGSLRLDLAVPVATPAEAPSLLRIGMISSLVVGLAAAPFAVHTAVKGDTSGAFGLTWATVSQVLVTALLIWSTASYNIFTSFSVRSRDYRGVAVRNLAQSFGAAAGQLALAKSLPSFLGLLLGQTIGRLLGLASLTIGTRKERQRYRRVQSKRLAREYWRYPLVLMPASLMNIASLQFPMILVSFFYSASDSGNLAQALRLTALPASLVGAAVASVVLAEISNRIRAGLVENRSSYLRVTKALFPIGMAWAMALLLVAPWALPVLLGPNWESSGQYAAALAPSVCLGLIVSPLTTVLPLYGKSALQFVLDGARLALVVGFGVLAWAQGLGPVMAVTFMSLALAAVYAATWIAGLRLVSRGSVS